MGKARCRTIFKKMRPPPTGEMAGVAMSSPGGSGWTKGPEAGLEGHYTAAAEFPQNEACWPTGRVHLPYAPKCTLIELAPIVVFVTARRDAAISSTTKASSVNGRRIAAFFDLDKTIIAKSSTFAFSRPFFDQGLLNRRAVLKSSYAHFLFLLQGADHDQMERMRQFLAAMSAGWDVNQVRTIVAETLHDIVDPLIFAEAADLIADHKIRGHDIVVVSASGEEVVQPIAELLGATYTAATRIRIADGKYTGDLDFYCYGEGKVEAIKKLSAEHGYDLSECFAYSDSITDLPMLQAVGHPTAVNPDRNLRKEAAANGWPILTFSNPVSLRSRMAPSTTTVAATLVVALSAAVAGAITYSLLKRRSA